MEASTQDLPFVLVYGPWIWKVGLGLLVMLALALAMAIRRRGARKADREQLEKLDRRDSDGVIRGTLGGSGTGPLAITLSATQLYEADERAHWRADELWVETADGRVRLEGPLTVELGTGGVAQRTSLPANLPPTLVAAAKELPRVEKQTFLVCKTATVAAGDEVVVRGRLERAPGTEDTTFREATVAWTLRPTGDNDPIRLAARRPRTVVARMPIWSMLVIGIATTFIGYKIAASVGDRWREDCWDRERYAHVDGFVELTAGDRCVRAAAMPGQADRAYEALYYALERHAHKDERSLARLIALADKAEGCRGVLDLLEETGRWDDMIVHARRCKLPEREYDALVATGQYAAAAKLPHDGTTDQNHIFTLVMAEDWGEAAVLAERKASEYRTANRADNDDGTLDDAASYYACIAELFRHHGGDARALSRLRELEKQPRGQVCLPALVEASTDADRPALLSRYSRERAYGYDARRAIDTQNFIEGASTPYEFESAERALVKLDDTMGMSGSRLAWVASLSKPAPAAHPYVRASVLRWRAVSAVLDGDGPEATHLAAEAVALVKSLDGDALELYPLLDVALLPASVALYSSAIVDVDLDSAGLEDITADRELRRMRAEARYFRFGRLPLRAGRPIGDAYFGPRDGYVEALVAAQGGDADLLAKYIGKERWWTEGDVLAVLPRVTKHRDQLVTKLAWSTNHASWRYSNRSPFDLASSAAVRRQMFRVAGEPKLADYWDGVYKRVDSALDRKRIMALVLWDN